jgi:hypothetical protein
MSWKEAGIALLAMLVVGFLVYLPHLRHGGFYLDDWADSAGTFYPPGGRSLGNTMSYFAEVFPYRPGLIIYVPLKYWALGADPAAQLSLDVALAVAIAFLLYGILRHYAVPWYHAGAIALLTLVFPSFDSSRLWEAASLPMVAIVIAFAGIWLALVALERDSWRLHLCATALYLLSVLTYEITLPLVVFVGILYVLRLGWKKGRVLWAVDLVAIAAGAIWNGTHTRREVTGISGNLSHLWKIVEEGRVVMASAADPLGSKPHTTVALLVLVAIFAFGTFVWARSRGRGATEAEGESSSRWGLGSWLLLGLAGLAVTALGWAIFIPANVYYTPSLLGFTNRVNTLAGLGLVMLIYAAIGTTCTVVGRRLPVVRPWLPVVIVAFGAVLGASYLHVLRRHIDIWDAAYREERTLIDRVKRAYPTLPPNSVLFTAGYPANYTLGVPIFTATWDINGMLKDEYKDGTLSGYPVFHGNRLVCRKDGVGLAGLEAAPTTARYGAARLFNVTTGKRALPENQAECERELKYFPGGELYMMTQY